MDIVIIIIVVVVILLSAAGKKKPQKSDAEPMRPALSDIQRAFMMSGEQAAPKRAANMRMYASQAPQTAEAYVGTDAAAAEALSSNRYAQIDLKTFHTDDSETPEQTVKTVKRQKSALTLFENKNDFVRAVVYSEILTRRTR